MKTAQDPQVPFEAPWHGQVFALAVALNEAGHFDWPEWAKMFSATLKSAGLGKPLNGSDDYYGVWVSTLEEMLLQKGMAETSGLTDMKTLWTEAFLRTPHGQPVIPDKLA